MNTGVESLTIAIVDDEPSVRTSLCRLCEALGMRATAYPSGPLFLESLDHAAAPDCVLLDAHMCEMSGLEVHEALARRGATLATVVITADDAPEMELRYRAAGVRAYLRKPIGSDELVTVIAEAVRATARAAPTPAGTD